MATAQGIEPAQPMADIEKCQPISMSVSAPSVVPATAERERGNELSREMRTEPAPQEVNEGAVSERGAELTPDKDTMDMDHEDDGQDRAQLKGEKETLEEPMPGQLRGGDNPEERCSNKVDECPDKVTSQIVNKDEDSYEVQSHRQEIELPSRPLRPEHEDGGQQHSDKVEECQDKVTPQAVNEEDGGLCCSSQICRPTEGLMESQDQQAYG